MSGDDAEEFFGSQVVVMVNEAVAKSTHPDKLGDHFGVRHEPTLSSELSGLPVLQFAKAVGSSEEMLCRIEQGFDRSPQEGIGGKDIPAVGREDLKGLRWKSA